MKGCHSHQACVVRSFKELEIKHIKFKPVTTG